MRKPKCWDKPITWGDNIKASLIGAALAGLVFGGMKLNEIIVENRQLKKEIEIDYSV